MTADLAAGLRTISKSLGLSGQPWEIRVWEK